MSLYPSLRSILFKLEPEDAHHLTLQLVRLAGLIPPVRWLLGAAFSAPQKPVEVFGLSFKNPVGLAAGYDKDGIAIQGLSSLGFGHIEIGTVTPRPQPGNPQPRVFRLLEDQSVINRMGFPSRGTEYMQIQLNPSLASGVWEWISGVPFMKSRKKGPLKRNFVLGVNLGKNKDTSNEQAVFDYLSLLQNYAPLADYLTINVSSPNTAGLRNLQGRDALNGLLKELHLQRLAEQTRLKKKLPLLVKLAPDLSPHELDEALDVIISTGMDGVIATNTTLSRDGLRSARQSEAGGLSGKALTKLSDEVLERVIRHVGGHIPVVGVGGIMGPEDARRKLDMGASLVQVYTGLIYAGPSLVRSIIKNI